MLHADRRVRLELPGPVGGQPHGRLRAAVVAVAQADDVGVAGELARRQDGDLVGLAAGVREVADRQAAPLGHVLGQLLAELGDGGMEVDRRRVLEPADLLADLLDDLGMTVADRDGDDPGEGVEVLLAGLVPDVLHVAFDDQQGLAIIRDQSRREILPAHGQHFVARRAVIRGRRVRGDRAAMPAAVGGLGLVMQSVPFGSAAIDLIRAARSPRTSPAGDRGRTARCCALRGSGRGRGRR